MDNMLGGVNSVRRGSGRSGGSQAPAGVFFSVFMCQLLAIGSNVWLFMPVYFYYIIDFISVM